jgi:hypothetical protein
MPDAALTMPFLHRNVENNFTVLTSGVSRGLYGAQRKPRPLTAARTRLLFGCTHKPGLLTAAV